MAFQKKHFIPYHEVPIGTSIEVANNLEKIGKSELKESALQYLLDYYGKDIPKRLFSCSVEMLPLFDVPNVIVLISFKRHPFSNTDMEIMGGLARIMINSKHDITTPVIFLMPNHSDDAIEHEKVHICQYLLPKAFPLTEEQKELYHSKNIGDGLYYLKNIKGVEVATDYMINVTCYKTWIELEANYVTRRPDNLYEWMMKVYISAQTIIGFNQARFIIGDQKYTDTVRSRFKNFCALLENEVDWIKDIVKRWRAASLEEIILTIHEEYEDEMNFGPIEIE